MQNKVIYIYIGLKRLPVPYLSLSAQQTAVKGVIHAGGNHVTVENRNGLPTRITGRVHFTKSILMISIILKKLFCGTIWKLAEDFRKTSTQQWNLVVVM